jgi:tetratricopeptide (TPR) repeat protein
MAAEQDDRAKLSSLDNEVTELYQAGKFYEAVPIAQESLELSEKALGPDHPDTSQALNNLAVLYYFMGDYARAEPLYQRALEVVEKALGPDHPTTAQALSNLAVLYDSMGDYTRAEPLYRRALKIREKALGPDHPDTSQALNNLAVLYSSMGDYAKAEPLYLRALKIREKVLGPDDWATAQTINNLAGLYRSMGDYAKAEPLYQRALRISRMLGPDRPDTATALNNLATLYYSMGDYAKAEPLYQRALKIREKVLGPDHPDTNQALSNLAVLYYSMGDYAKAEPLCQRALEIAEKALGPDHPATAQALNNLAALYDSMGDYAKAEPLYQRALKIREKALGPDHPDTAQTLNNLAELYRSMGYAKAEPLYKRALKIDEKALGPNHPATAQALNNLAALYDFMGNYAKAEPLYQRALKIREKALGPDHPDTAQTLNDLAFVKIALGETENALPLAKRAQQAEEKYLSNILSFTSEQQRLAFQKTTHPYALFANLGSAADLAQTVLRQKGVVLDSLLEDFVVAEASADRKQPEIIAQLRAAKQRLMQLVLEVPKDLSEASQKQRAAEKEKLSKEVERIEAGLAREVTGLGKARRALSITVPQVQSILPKQALLIELLRYDHYLGKGRFQDHYGAVVIPPNCEPKWVALGAAAEIEENVKVYQRSVREKTDEATLVNILKALRERVWAPIEKAFPQGCTTVIVSPDGELSFVSFATLLTPDDRFLGEQYSIRYVASGRDLLRETKPSDNPMTVVFANPDFDRPAITQVAGSSSAVTVRLRETRDLQSISLPPLPGTADEAAALEKRAGKAVKVFLGSNATEAELSQVNSPRVLHLATHGFFLPELELGKQADPLQRQPSEISKTKLENPMHRSGLALAGAQWTLDAWSRGEVPPIDNDGIVTAEEVSGLKLNGTWLVVLSASETGLGEARTGEGVMGLRRGFIQAGVQNLLMTLWPISDKITVKIMLDFYEAADRTHHAPEALGEVQRTWLVKLRKEFGLQAAVIWAGPFIMSSQGKP